MLTSAVPHEPRSALCRLTALAALLSSLSACSTAPFQREATPLDRSWYAERGVELPRPFGIGVNVIGMERDIEVTDVKVALGSLPPQSISDRARFRIENQTTLSMVRFDAWALPFLDVYVMLGETRTETSLNAQFDVNPPGGGAPVPVDVVRDSRVNGPLYGGGFTLVGGYEEWFAMVDANYTQSDLDAFEGSIDAWFLSARVGQQFDEFGPPVRVWGGVAFLASRRTLTIPIDIPLIGPSRVEVDQEPSDPVTYQMGGSVTIDHSWDLMLELGSNFGDAYLAVFGLTYRF